MFQGKGAQRWSTYLIARKRLEMTKNVFQINFVIVLKKLKIVGEKEETDKIRANKMIRGSPIKHDQVQK